MLICVGIFLVLYEVLIKRRFMCSVTIWVACYLVTFSLSPYLLEKSDPKIDKIALCSLSVFVFAVIANDIFRLKAKMNRKQIKQLSFVRKKLKADSADEICAKLLELTIVFLLIYIIGNGFSIAQISSYASGKTLETTSPAKALFGFFARGVTTFCIYSVIANKGKITKKNACNLSLIFLVLLIFGFTRISIVTALAMIVIYIVRNKSLLFQMASASICVLLLVMLMSIMMYVRVFGLQLGLQELLKQNTNDISMIKTRLANDLDFTYIYLAFCDEIQKASGMMVTPLCYLKPIFVIIPRTLWPGKPESLNVEIYKYLNPHAAGVFSTGYTLLGEAYAILGNVGFFVYPILWGIICSAMDDFYATSLREKNDNTLGCLLYLIFSVEIVIESMRGNVQQAVMNAMFPLAIVYLAQLPIKIKGINMKARL